MIRDVGTCWVLKGTSRRDLPNESSASHNTMHGGVGVLGLLFVKPGRNGVHVLQIAQAEETRSVDALDGWFERGRADGKNETVICFFIRFAVVGFASNALVFCINFGDRRTNANVEIETSSQGGWRLNCHGATIGDFSSNKVRLNQSGNE